MKPISPDELLPYEQYEKLRQLLRPLLISEKERRRFALGPHLTLLFENRQTVWYQIQEMLRTERISGEKEIAHELETYNEILPGANELSATLLIAYAEPAERDLALRELLSLDQHLWIQIRSRRIQARFDTRQLATDRLSSVQFVRFPLADVSAKAFGEAAHEGGITVLVDHQYLNVQVALRGDLAATLAADLES